MYPVRLCREGQATRPILENLERITRLRVLCFTGRDGAGIELHRLKDSHQASMPLSSQFLDHREGADALAIQAFYRPRRHYDVRARSVGPFEQHVTGLDGFPA